MRFVPGPNPRKPSSKPFKELENGDSFSCCDEDYFRLNEVYAFCLNDKRLIKFGPEITVLHLTGHILILDPGDDLGDLRKSFEESRKKLQDAIATMSAEGESTNVVQVKDNQSPRWVASVLYSGGQKADLHIGATSAHWLKEFAYSAPFGAVVTWSSQYDSTKYEVRITG